MILMLSLNLDDDDGGQTVVMMIPDPQSIAPPKCRQTVARAYITIHTTDITSLTLAHLSSPFI